MARVVVTLRIMPKDTDVDFSGLIKNATARIQTFTKNPAVETKHELKPVAFGLQALELKFVMDESQGSTEELEKTIATIPGIMSVEAIDVRRAVG